MFPYNENKPITRKEIKEKREIERSREGVLERKREKERESGT